MGDMGDHIRKMRVDRGWTQEDLAKMTNTGEKYISALERGMRKPGPKLIVELCNAFCITEKELRFGKPDDQGLDRRHNATLRRLVEITTPLSEPEQHILLGRVMQMIAEGLL